MQQLRISVQDDPIWAERIAGCTRIGPTRSSLHLAVFVEPYLSLLLAGTKSIESRFSQNPVAPFQLILPGDLVLLKRAGAEIAAIAQVANVKYLKRNDKSWKDLRPTYQKQLCATDDDFWNRVSGAWFASLIWFDHVRRLPAIECEKQDRRGWVVLKQATEQMALEWQ